MKLMLAAMLTIFYLDIHLFFFLLMGRQKIIIQASEELMLNDEQVDFLQNINENKWDLKTSNYMLHLKVNIGNPHAANK